MVRLMGASMARMMTSAADGLGK
jgi:hypothetical protein